MLLHLVNVLY
jgi:hypothetical protein